MAAMAWGVAAQEGEGAQGAEAQEVTVSAALEEVRAITYGDNKAGLDVVVRVTLENWSEAAFPQLDGRLVAFTSGGERSFSAVEVSVVEQVSPSEAVVRLRFERPESAPYLVAFVGVPKSDETGRPEAWTGVMFTEAEIMS